MNLPNNLLDEFAKVTHDPQEKKENTIFYGVAKFTSAGDFVVIDGATTDTPAVYATSAVNGDRVMGTIKNHKAIITANITNPSMTLGVLRAISGIIVEGYLTTNAERVRYDDQTRTGLTFSNGGMGAYGGEGKYWYITNTGDFRAEQAYVKGTISASSGFIGSEENGFKIDEYGIYSGANKTGTSSGFITLGNTDFIRPINGENRTLRFAIGANFGVTATGVLYANDANLQGEITATSGKIGNFDIDGALYSNNKSTFSSNNSGVYLGTDGIALGQDNKFQVTSAGNLTVKGDANITGVLTAAAGSTIGPWHVANTAIYYGTTDPLYNNASSLYFGTSGLSLKQNFLVDSDGNLTAKSGVIGNWTIGNGSNENNGSLYTTGTTLGADGSIFLIPSGVTGNKTIAGHADTTWVLACGSRFGVTKNGYMYSTGGQIGDFVINNGALYTSGHSAYNTNSNGVFLNKDYIALGPSGKFNVTSAGVLTASGATISGTITATTLTATTSGKIGPWSINSSALYMTSAAFGNASGIYLGTSGFSVKDVFKVDGSTGYLTIKPASGIAGATIGGSEDNNQHVQIGSTFLYIGNNNTARLDLTRDTIYFANGTYLPISANFAAAKFTYTASWNSQILTRTYYNNAFLVPVGSVADANRKVAALAGRSSYLAIRLQKDTSDWALEHISYNNSDIRLKENIAETEVHNALAVINKIDVRSFDWKDNREIKHQKIGMIADEIEKLDPLLTIGGGYDEDGTINAKSIDVLYLVGYLVKAIQELSNA